MAVSRLVASYRLNRYVTIGWCLGHFLFMLHNQTAVIASRTANTQKISQFRGNTMVPYNEVQSSNASLSKRHPSLTAVFAGATSGIGLATLKAFAKHTPRPNAIIIGRNQSKFDHELKNLQQINPNGDYTFLQSEISLVKNIDTVCEQVRSQLSSTKKPIDLLFLSQGYLLLGGRQNNAEGLDNSISLRYYGRVRMTQKLLPLMSSEARIVSVLAGGKEGKIFEDDMDLEKNFSIINAMGHFTSLKTLSFDVLAAQNPEKGFVHIFPGFVSTGSLGKYNTGIVGMAMRMVEAISDFLGFSIQVEESGERTLYYGTCEEFGHSSWVLDWDGKVMENQALKAYRADPSMGEKVMQHNARIFGRVTAS